MNLILRPLEDNNDPTWSVIISLAILLAGVLYYVVYILNISFKEMQQDGQAQEQEREVRKCEAEPGQRNSEEG